MNPAPDNFRYERKLLPVGRSLPEVLALIQRHPAGFREVYQPRWVNNLYLDSPALDDYHEHVNGLPVRSKSRIRWYGPLRGPIRAPRLERKFKQGSVGRKRTHALPPLALNGGIDEHGLRAMLTSPAAAEGEADRAASDPCGLASGTPPRPDDAARLTIDHRRPSLLNRYRRHYFLSGDGHVRLTVDSELEFLPPNNTARSAVCPPPSECGVVVELKYAPEHAGEAAAIASHLPFRMARCSKYVLGIEALHRAFHAG
ncbi:MAG: polyphosphate polymerase domain-containing protein [Verrucomicrobiales bacterium]|nr:polyphosphate polymerase domain-containing protein [Verrucomicrobiales bacterium]MCP5525419.1 polyphosphate polymerase domain-containing protein [Verrucomicrobiales bacterium]